MTILRRAALACLLGLAIAACGQSEPQEHKASLYVFGTQVDIVLRGVDDATAEAVTTRLGREFQHMHKDWHAWKPGELSDLNRALANGESKAVSPFLKPLILEGQRLEALSDGLFNPAIGRIIGLWGFHADEKPQGLMPDLDAIRALAARQPSMADIHFDGDVASTTNTAVDMDFGGFAKGVALDRAEDILREMGVENALVNAGGDLNTLGDGGPRPWSIGIRDPKAWGVIATIALEPGEDVYTSGNYERFREIDGVRYAHIIDPRTGMPVEHIVSSTVVAQNGALADAAATALSVAGPDGWYRIAKRMGLKYVALVDDQGKLYVNPAMRKRLKIAPDQTFEIVESPPL